MIHSSEDHGTGRADGGGLSENERHRLLAASERRAVLDVLADRQEPIDLTTLASAVADRVDAPTASSERAVKATLHHCHLPKLAAAGVVEYDTDAAVVASGASLPELLA